MPGITNFMLYWIVGFEKIVNCSLSLQLLFQEKKRSEMKYYAHPKSLKNLFYGFLIMSNVHVFFCKWKFIKSYVHISFLKIYYRICYVISTIVICFCHQAHDFDMQNPERQYRLNNVSTSEVLLKLPTYSYQYKQTIYMCYEVH